MRKSLQALVLAIVAFTLSGCSYNKFTTQEEAIKGAWGEVQNQLQRRNDLIPNLVETVKGFATHEEAILKEIAESRSRLLAAKSPEETIAAANQQSSALGRRRRELSKPQGERTVQPPDGRARRHREPPGHCANAV